VSSETVNIPPLIRRLASVECLIALLPIGMGALVTTLDAGMAFADWPTSDGQNMLLYPWLTDFRTNPDKFVEHGHRLAGMLIGLISVVLAVIGWIKGPRLVRIWTIAILAAVIVQGLLGGVRVLLDRQVMAMIHSATGAAFFCMCAVFRLRCSTRWDEWMRSVDQRLSPAGAAVILIAPMVIAGQYLLGGMLRHFHMMRLEHLAGAVLATLAGLFSAGLLLKNEHRLLNLLGAFTVAALLLQVALGAGAYITRFGLPQIGYVATQGSLSQSVICSGHTIGGMFLMATQALSAAALISLWKCGCLAGLRIAVPVIPERRPAA
jgi:cytochrome c oxidase assembly protein subunit 15